MRLRGDSLVPLAQRRMRLGASKASDLTTTGTDAPAVSVIDLRGARGSVTLATAFRVWWVLIAPSAHIKGLVSRVKHCYITAAWRFALLFGLCCGGLARAVPVGSLAFGTDARFFR